METHVLNFHSCLNKAEHILSNNVAANLLVFPSRWGETRADISKVFPKIVAELGLNDGITDHRDKIVFHTLRHTFAGLMGHKTTIMTQRYARLSPEGMKASAMLIEE